MRPIKQYLLISVEFCIICIVFYFILFCSAPLSSIASDAIKIHFVVVICLIICHISASIWTYRLSVLNAEHVAYSTGSYELRDLAYFGQVAQNVANRKNHTGTFTCRHDLATVGVAYLHTCTSYTIYTLITFK